MLSSMLSSSSVICNLSSQHFSLLSLCIITPVIIPVVTLHVPQNNECFLQMFVICVSLTSISPSTLIISEEIPPPTKQDNQNTYETKTLSQMVSEHHWVNED
uniref:Uncharacterized protein n=1 Tax=Arion vulgaris TaxID=1028688 RepID=A0A0B7AGS4_9EUPU